MDIFTQIYLDKKMKKIILFILLLPLFSFNRNVVSTFTDIKTPNQIETTVFYIKKSGTPVLSVKREGYGTAEVKTSIEVKNGTILLLEVDDVYNNNISNASIEYTFNGVGKNPLGAIPTCTKMIYNSPSTTPSPSSSTQYNISNTHGLQVFGYTNNQIKVKTTTTLSSGFIYLHKFTWCEK